MFFPQITLLADQSFLFWQQTFSPHDLFVILLLVFFEGVLSIDNAIVLGLLAKRLPKSQQKHALTYGLVGAFVFRTVAIVAASFLLEWRIVKLLGGAYLFYLAIKHLVFPTPHQPHEELDTLGEDDDLPESERGIVVKRPAAEVPLDKTFWLTVALIELTDIAFAVDSILAAIALIGTPPANHPAHMPHPKLWIVIVGGILGIVLMRIAAAIFIRLLERFPRFESAAYLLVGVIGVKLLADWGLNSKENPHAVDFHDASHPEFWIFWISMLVCLAIGFLPPRKVGNQEGADIKG